LSDEFWAISPLAIKVERRVFDIYRKILTQ